jgi:CRP-like cAMP-binding protein
MSTSIAEKLAGIAVFKNLTQAELESFAHFFREHTFHKGDIICKEGEKSCDFFVISKGFVDVIRIKDESETFVASLSEGAYFGESVLFQDMKRIATVRAFSDVEVLVINRAGFLSFVRQYPGSGNNIMLQMLKDVFDRLSRMVQDYQALQSDGLDQKEIDKFFS